METILNQICQMFFGVKSISNESCRENLKQISYAQHTFPLSIVGFGIITRMYVLPSFHMSARVPAYFALSIK
jgi:hypothetical protein